MVRFSILKTPLDIVTSETAIQKIKQYVSEKNTHQIITSNSLMILASETNEDLYQAYRKASLVVPDSVGIVFAYWWKTWNPLKRISGIDLLLTICDVASQKKWRIYFLGAKPGVALESAKHLQQRFPGLDIVGVQDGYFDLEKEESIIEAIQNLKVDILFVGMDLPRQDIWISKNIDKLGVKVAMGVGGSFDVLSGRLKRAPLWIQKSGGEWLYRLIQEPHRFLRILKLPIFLIKVLFSR